MKSQSKYIIRAAAIAICASIQPLSASVFDFDGDTPIYDSNRSTDTAGADVHYCEYTSQMVGFNWSNVNYGTVEYPYWFYSWDGFNVSTCSDTTVDISQYWNAGEKGQYTSITGTDADIVAGGTYAVFYGMGIYGTGDSVSTMGSIVFDSLSAFSSLSLANTLVTYNYLTTTLNADGDFHTQEVRVYGLADLDGTLTDNYVAIALSNASGVADTWIDADISALNTSDGLWGLHFEIHTDDFGDYGPNSPSYFAIDNIVYTSVPEPSTYAAIFGIAAFAVVVARRRIRK